MCHLLKGKATLAYTGRCVDSCKKSAVCGINGISYKSECEAWSGMQLRFIYLLAHILIYLLFSMLLDYSIADYDGECREIGLLTNTLGQRCASVKCNFDLDCKEGAIIPPGACCPICGGAIRIIYSRKQIDRALFALKGKNLEILSLKGILRGLDNLIHVAHCRLSGYLTIETDIFIIIHTVGVNLSMLQREACIREAEKIATLIETQSHRITSDLAMSALTVANVVRTEDLDLQFNLAIQLKPFYLSILILSLFVVNFHN